MVLCRKFTIQLWKDWNRKYGEAASSEEDGSCKLGDCKPDSCKTYPYTDQPERLFSLLVMFRFDCKESIAVYG